ncbi:MAG: Rieske 2Fe-2S domain-containing protein [Gammaproteobacteria bacterium]
MPHSGSRVSSRRCGTANSTRSGNAKYLINRAIEDVCTHDYAPLADAKLDGDEIICPRHGARFCIRTGAVMAPPAYEPVPTFPVRIHEGRVQVRDARWD